jgi:hypothetical protein
LGASARILHFGARILTQFAQAYLIARYAWDKLVNPSQWLTPV